jgi:hypothetical protein
MYRFPLEHNEQILKKGKATLHIDRDAYNGALYLTNERLVFVGYFLGANTRNEQYVSLKQIRGIKLKKSLFVIPNVLEITADSNEQLKFVVYGRDEWQAEIRNQMAAIGKPLAP